MPIRSDAHHPAAMVGLRLWPAGPSCIERAGLGHEETASGVECHAPRLAQPGRELLDQRARHARRR
jgi:hypothetical protein